MELSKNLTEADRNKIIFIQFNHTNPVVQTEDEAAKTVRAAGFRLANINDSFKL